MSWPQYGVSPGDIIHGKNCGIDPTCTEIGLSSLLIYRGPHFDRAVEQPAEGSHTIPAERRHTVSLCTNLQDVVYPLNPQPINILPLSHK